MAPKNPPKNPAKKNPKKTDGWPQKTQKIQRVESGGVGW
jgi:hypothetical protein